MTVLVSPRATSPPPFQHNNIDGLTLRLPTISQPHRDYPNIHSIYISPPTAPDRSGNRPHIFHRSVKSSANAHSARCSIPIPILFLSDVDNTPCSSTAINRSANFLSHFLLTRHVRGRYPRPSRPISHMGATNNLAGNLNALACSHSPLAHPVRPRKMTHHARRRQWVGLRALPGVSSLLAPHAPLRHATPDEYKSSWDDSAHGTVVATD